MTRQTVKPTLARLGLHAVLLSAGLLFMFPFIWSISTSLKPVSDLFQVTPSLIPSEFRWQNYSDVFSSAPFVRIYANTIFVTIARTIGQVFIASLAAFAFSQLRFPGRDFLFFLLLAGLMVPDQVLIVPRFIIMRQLDWFDTYQGLIIPLIFSSFGVFLLRQFFLGIPKEFHEAAKLEGANPFQIYWDIYLPLARPALAAFGFLAMLFSWNEFLWALTVTGDSNMRVLSVGIALFQGQFFTNNAILLAAANMATFPLLIAFLFFQKQLVEGIALSGLK
ncbi:MAG: carbohydrate ABC transporter permease [Chloroflexota bacterium]|jgi:multiple sugar transport system permease protein|nr:carbohydrate ABC transporter permease [Chloroflexota bacterium]